MAHLGGRQSGFVDGVGLEEGIGPQNISSAVRGDMWISAGRWQPGGLMSPPPGLRKIMVVAPFPAAAAVGYRMSPASWALQDGQPDDTHAHQV